MQPVAEDRSHILTVREFGEISLKKASASPRLVIEALLCDPKCFGDIKPFFMNGGVCGHKVMDIKGAVDALKRRDMDRRLANFHLNDYQIGNALKTVLRSRYDLNKYWKIGGENAKRVLPAPADEE